jgi:flavin-dependent dehydrogenase
MRLQAAPRVTDRPHALVIGGGPAGAALATTLARAGREVVLLEREHGPHDKVCGEFISGEAASYLADLGLDLARLGAVRIARVRLAQGARQSQTALPFAAFSLSRRRLDAELLAAAAVGVRVRQGAKVKGIQPDGDGWRAVLDDGETLSAPQVFLAVGKHDLKGHRRPEGPQGDLIAFKLHLALAPDQAAAVRGAVELALFPGGYAGLQPIEDGKANLCLLVRRAHYGRLGSWPALLDDIRRRCGLLDQRLTDARPLWDKPLAIAAIPYGHVLQPEDGLWRLGDQAAVIPSFAGDGLAIALHSAALASRTYLAGGSASDYGRRIARDLGGQVRGATLLSQLLVRGPFQTAMMTAARIEPRLMAAAARLTRISPAALRLAGTDGGPCGYSLPPSRG